METLGRGTALIADLHDRIWCYTPEDEVHCGLCGEAFDNEADHDRHILRRHSPPPAVGSRECDVP